MYNRPTVTTLVAMSRERDRDEEREMEPFLHPDTFPIDPNDSYIMLNALGELCATLHRIIVSRGKNKYQTSKYSINAT